MAYDITPKTQPANMDYENSKNFSQLVQVAHDEAQFERTRRANQPSKYTQTLQAINSTLQTVNTGLQIAENVNKVYDQITEKSFKREQLDKQNRLKEKIQGAINEHDWNTVATLAMTNIQTASQMPEYMDSLGRMAKIEGNEGSAAILRSINTEQQGKLEVEEIKNLGKLQVAQENTRGKIAAANVSGQWGYKTAQYNQEQENLRQDKALQNTNQGKIFDAQQAIYMENLQAQNGKYANKTGSGRGARSNAERYRNSQQGEQNLAEVEQGKGTGATVPASTQEGQPTQQAASPSTMPAHLQNFSNYTIKLTNSKQDENLANKKQAFNNSTNAPSKQEQEKANQQKKDLLQNQQNTSQLVGSFANKELDFALDNLDVEGASIDEQITNVMRNPDNYKIEMVTEQSKINDIINGGNRLQTPINNNLSDKYKNVVSIAKITDRNTGRSENVYLNTQQAGLFSDMRKYNKQYAKEFKRAMGETSKELPKFTPAEVDTTINRAISNPGLSYGLTAKYGVPNTTDNVRKIVYYTANNPNASVEDVKKYISNTSIDEVYYDQVYGGYNPKYDDYIERFNIKSSNDINGADMYNEGPDTIEKRNFGTYTNNTKETNEDKYNTYLIDQTSMKDEFTDVLIGKDYLNKTITSEEIIEAFNKSIKKAMYDSFVDNEVYSNFNMKDPNDVIKIINRHPTNKRTLQVETMSVLKDKYPEIYESYKAGKNRDSLVNQKRTKLKREEDERKSLKKEKLKRKEQEEIRNRFD